MITFPSNECSWFFFDNFSSKLADMQTLPGWSWLPLLQFAQVVELVILELVFTNKNCKENWRKNCRISSLGVSFHKKFCTFRFTSADYIGPVDARGMVIDKEVSVKIWKKKIMIIILIPSTPQNISHYILRTSSKIVFPGVQAGFQKCKISKERRR